jgi:hypothetical protein
MSRSRRAQPAHPAVAGDFSAHGREQPAHDKGGGHAGQRGKQAIPAQRVDMGGLPLSSSATMEAE